MAKERERLEISETEEKVLNDFFPQSIQDEQINKVFVRLKKNLTQEQIENLEKVAISIIGKDKYRD